MWSTIAYAAEQTPGGGFLQTLIPLAAMFAIFYFLLIRPQQKKVKMHRDFLNKLQRGEEVVTSSGLLGTVTGMTDKIVTLEVAENVRMKVLKSHVAGYARDESAASVKSE